MNKLVLLSLTLAACTHDITEFDRVDEVETGSDLDVLYVFDTSADRANYAAMADQLDDLTAGLAIDGQLPSLHVGVVTADLGATGTDDASPQPTFRNCAGSGDGGRLTVFDAQLGKSFLEDLRGPDGTRVRNFAGDDDAALTSQLAALTAPPTTKTGCEIAQPMEAMRRALDPATNPAFLRDHANLMVVFLSSDDDCSLKTGSLVGPGGGNVVRCASAGLICSDGDAGTPGVHTNCRPREDSTQVVPVADYVTFLTELKGTKGKVVVNAVAGPDDPFFVLEAGGSDLILDSCAGPGGGHRPAPRINALVDAFDGASVNGCTQDTAYQTITQSLANATASCVPALRAADGDNCRVIERAGGVATELPSCDDAADGACYTLFTSADACPRGDNVGISIDRRASAAPVTSKIEATCFVAD